MLSLIGLNFSCSLLAITSPPKLEQRTLWLSEEIPGFFYHYCVKESIFGNCKEYKTDYYDLTDVELRKKLKNMGFVLKVHQKPI